jgi:D-alanine-D-alanine ligase
MSRLRVAVIFGGLSSEHAISCISAGSVLRSIDRKKYEVVPIGITKRGQWVLEQDNALRLAVHGTVFPSVSDTRPHLLFTGDPTSSELVVQGGPAKGVPRVDVAFPLLHGPWGEDGTIQGMFELAGIPYVGSGVFASAAAMDKAHMKALLRAAGLPVGRYEVITDGQWRTQRDESLARVQSLGLPVFVKPSRAGSSVGITKVKTDAELVPAIEAARLHDPKVVVEASVEGNREIECGILDSAQGPRASVIAEIVVRRGHDFYDYEAKYVDDSVDLIVPAALPAGFAQRAQELAKAAFLALDCEGLARVDMFIAGGEIVINEVNTMPGFTPISMFPRMWQESGLDYPTLIDTLIQDAMRRGTGLR